jgi:hypothetical protein
MTVSEFVLAFVSIIIGLGVADLLVSFHHLLRAGRRVKWDWLAPSFAITMLLLMVVFWWWSFHWYGDVKSATALSFLPKFLFLCVSFLMIAAALPDEIPEQGIDLREFYFASRIRLWSLVSFTLLLVIVIDIADNWIPETAKFAGIPWKTTSSLIFAVGAACSPRVWVQALAIGWLFCVIVSTNLLATIGG